MFDQEKKPLIANNGAHGCHIQLKAKFSRAIWCWCGGSPLSMCVFTHACIDLASLSIPLPVHSDTKPSFIPGQFLPHAGENHSGYVSMNTLAKLPRLYHAIKLYCKVWRGKCAGASRDWMRGREEGCG